jgi:integrase
MKLSTLPALEEQLIKIKGKYLIMKSENFKESLAFFRNTLMGEGLKKSTAKTYVTDVEACQIIAAAKRYGDINAKRDSALLAICAFTGCRIEEAANQIDFSDRTLLLTRSKTSNFNKLHIHKELYNSLLEYYTERSDCLQRYPDPQPI